MFNISLNDLYWVAGFLEGEGSFMKCGVGTIVVSATQVQREPLTRLHKFFGGNLNSFSRKDVKGNVYHRWQIYGPKAEIIMKMLFPILSPRRQNQITTTLTWYASRPGKNFCKSGRTKWRKCEHPFTTKNTYVFPGSKKRVCKTCMNAGLERYKKKQINRINEFIN